MHHVAVATVGMQRQIVVSKKPEPLRVRWHLLGKYIAIGGYRCLSLTSAGVCPPNQISFKRIPPDGGPRLLAIVAGIIGVFVIVAARSQAVKRAPGWAFDSGMAVTMIVMLLWFWAFTSGSRRSSTANSDTVLDTAALMAPVADSPSVPRSLSEAYEKAHERTFSEMVDSIATVDSLDSARRKTFEGLKRNH